MDKALQVLEDRDWNVNLDSEWPYLEWYSPAGEDYIINLESPVTLESIYQDVRTEYENFDVDEHVDLWAPGRGKNGVPDSYAALVHDAEAIDEELHDLYLEIQKIWNEE